MQWHNLDDFLAMGGYGFYVWGSLLICLTAMLIEPWLVARRRARIVTLLREERAAKEIQQ